MLTATLINFTGSTTEITKNVSGIFSSFKGIIALLIAVPIGIWILKFLIGLIVDNYYDQKEKKAITEALRIAKQFGYTPIPPPTPQEIQLQKALRVLKEKGVKLRKGE